MLVSKRQKKLIQKNKLTPFRFTSDDIDQIPKEPGVYHMLNHSGDIIYIGKAKNLFNRVKSYFRPQQMDFKTAIMVPQIVSIDIILTKTESDAFVLENQSIKQFQPKYNISLKDDKSYPYIKITTQETFPRVLIVRHKKQDGATYYGPYPSMGSSRKLQRILLDLFPLRDCKMVINLTDQQEKCINLDIGKCLGPCVDKNIYTQYQELIQQLHRFLKGDNKQLVKELRRKMLSFSSQKAYEKAATIRDRIQKIEALNSKQEVQLVADKSFQIWVFSQQDSYVYLMIQTWIQGKLLKQQGVYNLDMNATDFIDHALCSLGGNEDYDFDQYFCDDFIYQRLKLLYNVDISSWKCPQKGRYFLSLELAKKNAVLALQKLVRQGAGTYAYDPEKIQELLSLSHEPRYVLGFDISHLQGTHIVASSVCFMDGKPNKKAYRSYNIHSVSKKSNDPKALYEVVSRCLLSVLADHKDCPDLCLIDGGQAQLNAAIQAISDVGLLDRIDVVSLAKKKEELYLKDSENTILCSSHPSLLFFQRVRDEAHRFAVSFQRQKRSLYAFETVLGSIKGLGKKRISLIYQSFPDLDKITRQDLAKLSQIGKMGNILALKVLETLGVDKG